MRFSEKREMKHTKIEIIPMIDTMFFLLVFFVLASLNIIDLRGLNLILPEAGPGPTTKPQRDPKDVKLEIGVDRNGNKVVRGDRNRTTSVKKDDSATKAILEEVVRQMGTRPTAKQLQDVTVVIAPDPETWHQWVISAVDDARGANIEKFSIR
jgi:biopolymer transport protein ExbD